MRYLLSVGEGNGLYRWAFFGDKKQPDDLLSLFEKTENEKHLEETKDEPKEVTLPTFDQKELEDFTEQGLAKMRQSLLNKHDSNSAAPLQQTLI